MFKGNRHLPISRNSGILQNIFSSWASYVTSRWKYNNIHFRTVNKSLC